MTGPRPPVLVTGATGFLGRHLLSGLDPSTGPVRLLARNPAPDLEARGFEVRTGDVTSPDSLREAMEGISGVFHLAGRVSRDPEAAPELDRVHVEGARRLAEAAEAASVRRIVLVSTSGTIAVSRDPAPDQDETTPTPVGLIGGWPYYRSKWLQERTLLGAGGAFELVIVHPSLLLGPEDDRLSSTGDILRFLSGRVSVCPPGGLNFVDVRDAARTIIAAMDRGRAGERYLVGGPNWSFEEFFACLGELTDRAPPRLRLPRGMYTAGALLTEEVARQLGREPAVDRISREMAACYWWFRSVKAERELGHEAREGRLTLSDTVRWLDQRV